MANDPAIRVTQYRVGPGLFTGTDYVLKLNRALLPNYFVLLAPALDGANLGADSLAVRVDSDPFGSGYLFQLGNDDEINLHRGAADADWVGVITVVESERDHDVNGFRLRTVLSWDAVASTAVGLDAQSSPVLVGWQDIAQVALFGGLRGGGVAVTPAGTDKYPSALARIYPSGDDVVHIDRWENTGAGSRVGFAVFTVYVVEWGSAWTVQRAPAIGGGFGDGTLVTHWNTATFPSSVTRANTWVWGCGYSEGDTPGDSFAGAAIALGDGVTENATETQAAVNFRANPTSSTTELYAMTHPSAVVDWGSLATGRDSFETYDQAVAAPLVPEVRSFGAPHGLDVVTGRRIGLWTAHANATALTDWPAAIDWYAMHQADQVLRGQRLDLGAPAAWLLRSQSVDLGAVLASSEAVAAGSLEVPGEPATSTTTNLVLVPDHGDQAVADLMLQLRKPRITSLVRALAEGAQVLEDDLFSLLVDRELSSALGDQLDQWGAIVGEQRGALDDDDYRRFITARVLANRSGGSADELIRIWALVMAPTESVRLVPKYPAGIHLEAVRTELISADTVRRVVRLMEDARPTGISLTLIEAVIGYYGFQPDPDASGLNAGVFARTLT